MSISEYIDKKKQMVLNILQYLDDELSDETNIDIKKINEIFIEHKLFEDENEFRSFLELLDRITCNHHRSPNFFDKIDKILSLFKDTFKKFMANSEIYNVFCRSKRVLLFLLENEIINIDYCIFKAMAYETNYYEYFYKEIKPFLDEETILSIQSENPNIDNEFFERNRKEGENDTFICSLIRNDNIEEFISFTTKKCISLKSKIEKSIFESNYFLLEKEPTLIEYAAFFGSIQIYQYLRLNNVEMPSSLWLYSIHGRNPEIIHLIEEDKIEPEDKSFEEILRESIRCHHNEIVEYIINNYSQNQENIIEYQSIQSVNYQYYPTNINNDSFNFLCIFGNYFLVEKALIEQKIDANFEISRVFNNEFFVDKPLISSIWCNKANVAELLMKKSNFEINFVCSKCTKNNFWSYIGATFMAVMNDNIKIMKLLFTQKDLDVNVRFIKINKSEDNYFIIVEETPLYRAIFYKNYEMIDLLLSHQNIDVNLGYKLFEYPKNIDDWGYFFDHLKKCTPLYAAIDVGDIEIVKKLLSKKEIKVNKKIIDRKYDDLQYVETSLSEAIRKSKIDIVKLLLSHPNINLNKQSNIKIDDKEYTESPLHLAIRVNKIEIVKLLLEKQDIDINMKSLLKEKENEYEETALNLAIKSKNTEIVKLLLEKQDIDINMKSLLKENEKKYEETALSLAIKNKNIEIVKLLLEKQDIDINMKSLLKENEKKYEETALSLAIKNKNIEIVQLLLNHPKINLNIFLELHEKKDNKRKTTKEQVIHSAIKSGDKNIVDLLLKESKIDVNSKMTSTEILNINDDVPKKEITINTPLHIAVLNNANDIVSLLISHKKININKKGTNYIENNEYKWNALTMAIYKKQVETCQLLLSNQCIDINSIIEIENVITFYEKKSALYLAVENENEEIVDLLLSHHDININSKSLSNLLTESLVKETYVLHKAFEMKNINIIKKLINFENIYLNVKSNIKKFDENGIEDEYQCTLNLAISFADVEIVKLLLSNGNLDVKNVSYNFKASNKCYKEEEKDLIEESIKCQNKEVTKLILEYFRKNNHDQLMKKINLYIEMANDEEIKMILSNIKET